jgi:DNA mismatch endonuclease (patch repair protein)
LVQPAISGAKLPERISKEIRSRNMARIRSKNTGPERQIRALLHRAGFRFRLHRRDLPGTPDIVLPKHRAVIDVRGCYWHAHDCHLFRQPTENAVFWSHKLNSNRERDLRNGGALEAAGWRQLVVWECALKGRSRLSREEILERLKRWIESGCGPAEIRGDDGTNSGAQGLP